MASNDWRDTLPPGVDAYVDVLDKNWKSFRLDAANTTLEWVNGYLLHHILYYRRQTFTDSKLWEYFQEDFEDWTLETWKLGNTKVVWEFRDFLWQNRVYVIKNRALIAGNIQMIITNSEKQVWIKEEIQK